MARRAAGWLLPAAIAVVALFLYINGSFFSTVSALHIDFSINYTAAHALRDGDNPYGETTLLERAKDLDSPTNLIYATLFTSYIQPPTSALSIIPLTLLDWREASRLYLVVNNVFLMAAIGLTLYTVRPSVPWRWAFAGAAVVLMGVSQVYASLALGQVDATLTLLLAIGYWAYRTERPAVAGSAIALGAAIKIIPGLLLIYFLWKREYRVVLWGAGVGLGLLVVSLPAVGFDTYRTYLTDVVPALAKGSTHYSNASLPGAVTRIVGEGLPPQPYMSLAEVGGSATPRLLSLVGQVGLLAAAAAVVGLPRSKGAGPRPRPEHAALLEYYLVVAVGLLISSVTWEFYTVWLLPLFLAAFVAPDRVLPGDARTRWLAVGVLAAVFVGLNYPGDLYLFDVNSLFYHPSWVPGVWVEDRLRLYHDHIRVIPWMRVGTLLVFAGTLGWLAYQSRAAALGARRPSETLAAAEAADTASSG